MPKRIFNFIRSMKFGVILLIAIAVLCILATTLDQEGIYSSWYFITLFCLLAVNLLLCSVVRVTKIGRWKSALLKRAENAEVVLPVQNGEEWLKAHHFHKDGKGYIKNVPGFTGTFFTHLSMLLLTLAAGFLFAFAKSADVNIFPGESYMLPDNTEITVEDFSLVDESGSVEYKSTILGILPNGTEVSGDILVNYPLTVGQYKIYQQSYAYAVPVGVQTSLDEEQEFAVLDSEAFLGLDDTNGIAFNQIFGNVVEEDGEVKVSSSDEMINPGYEVAVVEDGTASVGIVFPGTTLEVDGVYYTFYEPEAYPGLRFKTQPVWAVVLLYISFILMLVGLLFSFFVVPEAAFVRKNGIAIVGQKDISQRLEFYKAEEAP